MPPCEATSAYSPSCSTRIMAILRTLPLLLPLVVTTMTGSPVSRSVLARSPPDASYSATWSRTQSQALGSYSPWIGMAAGYDSSVDRWAFREPRDQAPSGRRVAGARCSVHPGELGASDGWSDAIVQVGGG